MNNKRQRPYLEQDCKKREPEAAQSFDNGVLSHLKLSPKLWRELPTGLAYKVLSYLPIDKFVDTLRHVNRNFLTSPSFSKIFGHGDNLLSSYGFVTVPNREVPKLAAFEHKSMQWREFPKKLPAEVKQARLVSGGNDGLLMFQSKKCWITNLTFKQMNAAALALGLFSPNIGRDSWDRFFASKILTDLDCRSHGAGKAQIDSFAILRGILYTLICSTSEGIVMASTDLSAETVTFKLETIVRVPSLPLESCNWQLLLHHLHEL